MGDIAYEYQIINKFWRRSLFLPIKILGKKDYYFYRFCFWGGILIWNIKGDKIKIKGNDIVLVNGKPKARFHFTPFSKKTAIGKKVLSIELFEENQKFDAIKNNDSPELQQIEIDIIGIEKKIGKIILMSTLIDTCSKIVVYVYDEKYIETIIAAALFISVPTDGYTGG